MTRQIVVPPGHAPDLGNTLRERWRHYLKRRTDEEGVVRDDLLARGIDEIRRMPLVFREELPAPPGAPAPTVFAGVGWTGIGPQPLRIDAEQNFQGAGPASGEVVDILIDPGGAADSTIYVAVNNGGVWKSTNGGTTWTPRNDFMPSLSMGALVMDPVDHDVLYAGTGNNFDGGAQFNRGRGIYRSIDAGETWAILADAVFLNKQIVRMVMPAPDVLLVATNAGLYRSIDAGRHFGANAPAFDDGNALVAGNITDLALDTASAATVYAAVRGTGLFRSSDAGATFPTDLFTTPGAPSAPFDWISFAQSVSPDNQVLYALVTDSTVTPQFKGLFRSSDRGGTWTLMPGAQARAAENNGLQNGYDVVVAVDPLDPNRVYIGFQELYRSLDGGQNFGTPAITRNFVHWDHHGVRFTPHRPAAARHPVLRRHRRRDLAQRRRQYELDEPQRDDRVQPADRDGHRPRVGRQPGVHLRGRAGHRHQPAPARQCRERLASRRRRRRHPRRCRRGQPTARLRARQPVVDPDDQRRDHVDIPHRGRHGPAGERHQLVGQADGGRSQCVGRRLRRVQHAAVPQHEHRRHVHADAHLPGQRERDGDHAAGLQGACRRLRGRVRAPDCRR